MPIASTLRRRLVRFRRPLLIAAGLFFIAINVIAWLQARSMVRLRPHAARTAAPESLSAGRKLVVLIRGVSLERPENTITPADRGLPYSVEAVGSIDGRMLELWRIPHRAGSTAEAPRGTAILFHGYGACKQSLLDQAEALNELGFETLLADFPGSGGSSGSRTSLGYYEADDVAAVVLAERRLHPERRIVLFGGSMGSVAILRAVARRGATADALIVENPFDRLSNAVRNRFAAMGLPSFPGAEMLLFWGSIELGYNGFGHNTTAYASSVTIPTLMFEGAEDRRATPRQARAVFERLAGPKEMVIVPGAGHVPLIAAAPVLWRARCAAFLDRALGEWQRPTLRHPPAADGSSSGQPAAR